jgi:hypothetical protein
MTQCVDNFTAVSPGRTDGRRQVKAARPAAPRRTADWVAYFRRNAARCRPIPWGCGAEVTVAELSAIGRSLQAWQLGETSDGRHLRAAAERYAACLGDTDYPAAIDLFIREEQRHGEMLGRFLDLAGLGRRTSDWGDRLFRAARYCLTNVEVWTTPVVMVETLAMIYYNAIRRATGSAVLQTICSQILSDEVPHVQFQCERLSGILARRPRWGRRLTLLAHRPCFLLIVVLVWVGHRRALRAGGYGWRHYWRAAWSKMSAAWRLMDPHRTSQDAAVEVGGVPAVHRPARAHHPPAVADHGGLVRAIDEVRP